MPDDHPYGTYTAAFEPDGGARIIWTRTDRSEPVPHTIRHSPDGLNWGYAGRGPADTALSILHHATGDLDTADALHQQFKRDVIATLEINEPFDLSGQHVAHWLYAHGAQPAHLLETDAPSRSLEPTATPATDLSEERLLL